MTGKQAAQEIRMLSSGTIGTLTGLKRYAKIDRLRERNAFFVNLSERLFESWVDAWNWIEAQNRNNASLVPHNEY